MPCVPKSTTGKGRPCGPGIGLQIVGKPYGEASLLSFAAWVEEILGSRLERPILPRGPVPQP